jgi:myo-inositol-1(or 4)-monophosphatase
MRQKGELMPLNLQDLASEMEHLLRNLGDKALRIRASRNLETEIKGKKRWDIITKADKAVEAGFVEHMKLHHPDHRIRGEEGTRVSREESSYEWIVDPIDGTQNIACGSTDFGISAGLLEDGTPVLGAIEYPALRTFAVATRSGGTWVNGHRCLPEPFMGDFGDAIVVTDLLLEQALLAVPVQRAIRGARMFGSFVFDTLKLLNGHVDAVFHMAVTPFDVAAAIVLAEEAGCTVSGLHTLGFDFATDRSPIVIARSKKLHDELCKLLITNEALLVEFKVYTENHPEIQNAFGKLLGLR